MLGQAVYDPDPFAQVENRVGIIRRKGACVWCVHVCVMYARESDVCDGSFQKIDLASLKL